MDHRLLERREIGKGLVGALQRGVGHDFHERRAGAVVVDERLVREVVELADVFLEVDAGERDRLVLAHDVARRTGQLDLDAAAEAEGLVVLGELIVLRRVRVEIVFPVPFADRGDGAAEHEAGLDRLVDGLLVEHGQHAGQREHDGVGERVFRLAKACGHAGEHLGLGLELDVNFKTDDGFVLHEGKGMKFGTTEARSAAGLINESFDALLQDGDLEIDEQADLQIAEFEVGKELGLVDRQERVGALELDDHLVGDEQIEAETFVETQAFVGNGHGFLPLAGDPP